MTIITGRTSRLGGEIRRRGLLGGSRSRVGNMVLGSALAVGIVFALGVSGLAGIGIAAVVFGTAWLLTRQNPVTGRSPGRELALAVRWQQRQRRGETELVPVHLATPMPAPQKKAERRAVSRWARSVRDEAPGLEEVEWLDPDGVGPAVLLHHPAGDRPYLTVAIEVDGQPAGLRSQRDYDRASASYGRLLARLAREDGLIAGVQSLTHIVPLDSAAHERWASDHIDRDAPPVLIDSYAELVRMTAGASEMVRHYLVLRMPLTARYAQEASRYGEGDTGQAALAVAQAEWVASLAQAADLRNPRLLTNHRLAALLRHLQNPDFPIDQTVDVSARTWLRGQRATRQAAVVDERWFHRVAAIPRSAVTPEPVGSRWIAPLLHGINTPVIRTISLCVAVQPAARARRRAREDLTVDVGERDEAARRGAIDDGTQAVQMTASAQRLADLQPGSGIHGAEWSGWVSIAATSMDDVMQATTTVTDAAGECGIGHLDWLDRRHDEALPTTWPVWRGMEVPQ
ncbi:SCO6880 family protein [Actinoplanes sp. NPDC051851]|uniref:SCO6880 family protein n=1 Tax=Actinoplanes sp. NPDC051851 TaxID=3154753 RepID=UPI00343A8152